MFKFLKGLLSSGQIIDGGISALDKMVLTEEEKKDLKLKFITATMPMNRTRRTIALFVVPIWASHALLGTYLFLQESARFGDYLSYMNTNITLPFSLVVGFYYWNERIKGT